MQGTMRAARVHGVEFTPSSVASYHAGVLLALDTRPSPHAELRTAHRAGISTRLLVWLGSQAERMRTGRFPAAGRLVEWSGGTVAAGEVEISDIEVAGGWAKVLRLMVAISCVLTHGHDSQMVADVAICAQCRDSAVMC